MRPRQRSLPLIIDANGLWHVVPQPFFVHFCYFSTGYGEPPVTGSVAAAVQLAPAGVFP